MDWDIKKLQMINNPPCSAHQASEQQKILDQINAEQRRKDNAILQTAQASIEQKEFLEKQLEEVKLQNVKLDEANKSLNALYEQAKKDAEESAKDAKNNRIFGWVSFAVGTFIGIIGVALGIIF